MCLVARVECTFFFFFLQGKEKERSGEKKRTVSKDNFIELT